MLFGIVIWDAYDYGMHIERLFTYVDIIVYVNSPNAIGDKLSLMYCQSIFFVCLLVRKFCFCYNSFCTIIELCGFSIFGRHLYSKASKLLSRLSYYPRYCHPSIPAFYQLGIVAPVIETVDYSIPASFLY